MSTECHTTEKASKSERGKAYRKAYYEKNKEKIKASNKAYREKNPGKTARDNADWRARNADHIKVQRAEKREPRRVTRTKWVESNREKVRAIDAKSRANRLDKIKAYHSGLWKDPDYVEKRRVYTNSYRKNRLLNDPMFKVVKNLRRRINHAVHRNPKVKRSMELVGCSTEELKRHLESLWKPGMSWSNYSRTGWHIDHKVPCASFDLSDPAQQKACFHFSNLQPLWWFENLSKGSS